MREPASHVVKDPSAWSTFDDQTSEDETIRLIAALVDAIKPRVSVEVGSYVGATSELIGQVILRYGHLHTFEIDAGRAQLAIERCARLPVTVHLAIDTDYDAMSLAPIDFLFVDGDLFNRGESLRHWKPALSPGALIAVHDSLKYPEVAADVAPFRDYQHIDIVTPRGLTLLRCPQSSA